MTHVRALFLVLTAGAAFFAAMAEEKMVRPDPAADYQSLFGDEEKTLAKQDAKAVSAFAARLLASAQKVAEQKDLQALLCQKAYEYGMKFQSGYATAADAMRLLLKSSPDDAATIHEKLLKAIQAAYGRSAGPERRILGQQLLEILVGCGDERFGARQNAEALGFYRRALDVASSDRLPQAAEITEKIRQISAVQETERRVKELRARLDVTPRNVAMRTELILTYLSELNVPDQAVALLNADLDDKFRAGVLLAATKSDALDESGCLELAHWYVEVREKTPIGGKLALLDKAEACCQRFLELHSAQDGSRLKAQKLLEEIQKAIEKSSPRPPRNLTLDPGGASLKLTLVPAGSFLMGSPAEEKDRFPNEGPQREVTISKPYYIGTFEVTRGQFAAFVNATAYVSDAEKEGWATAWNGVTIAKMAGASWKKPGFAQTDEHPVVCVTQNDSLAFCAWLSRKTGRSVSLPTEAQWEYACRAGGKTRMAHGESDAKLGEFAWYDVNGEKKTHPVGMKKPNALGLFDITGNAWERCSDWYAETYPKTVQSDPAGPASGTMRVLRGGGWNIMPPYCRCACRMPVAPDSRMVNVGFRVVAAVR